MHDFSLVIDGQTITSSQRETIAVIDPATETELGRLPCATAADLDRALEAASRGFRVWKATPVLERSDILRRAAQITRERAETIAAVLTLEQGKPRREALGEVAGIYETFEWFAEECRRNYGRIVPSQSASLEYKVVQQPVGPVLVLTPWNFPVAEVATHLAPALAAGCSAIIKATEEAPSATVMLVRILHEAGLPNGVVNLVYGDPAMISNHLIGSPLLRKVAFTGSVAVGKHLAVLAAATMKSVTLELGGNAPAIVFDDVDVSSVVSQIAYRKFRNAGQVCTAPNRILVHDKVFDRFVAEMTAKAKALKVGAGADPDTEMGPLVNARRLEVVSEVVRDAVARGGRLVAGGDRVGNRGYFFQPTVLVDVPEDAMAVREEIFGPIAVINRFTDTADVIARSNSVPVGLASYVFTRSASTAHDVSSALEFGMVGINTLAISTAEYPFGGVKDSGIGRVGGSEGLAQFLETKTITTDFSA